MWYSWGQRNVYWFFREKWAAAPETGPSRRLCCCWRWVLKLPVVKRKHCADVLLLIAEALSYRPIQKIVMETKDVYFTPSLFLNCLLLFFFCYCVSLLLLPSSSSLNSFIRLCMLPGTINLGSFSAIWLSLLLLKTLFPKLYLLLFFPQWRVHGALYRSDLWLCSHSLCFFLKHTKGIMTDTFIITPLSCL